MTPFPTNLPKANQLVRHVDGGIYQFLLTTRHTDTLEPLCIYSHLWPFAPGEGWARPAHEWLSRFTPITQDEYEEALKSDIQTARQAVIDAKAARRAAEKSYGTRTVSTIKSLTPASSGAPNNA